MAFIKPTIDYNKKRTLSPVTKRTNPVIDVDKPIKDIDPYIVKPKPNIDIDLPPPPKPPIDPYIVKPKPDIDLPEPPFSRPSPPTPYKETYTGSGMVGRSEAGAKVINYDLVNKLWGGTVEAGWIKFQRWLGIFTRNVRGLMPLGALETVQNLIFNSTIGGMVLRSGISSYSSTFVDVSTSTTLTGITKTFHLTTEIPVATNIDILFGVDGTADKHIFQKPFFHCSTTATSSYLRMGERLVDITIKSTTTNTVVFTGGVNSLNYYKDWVALNEGYLFVTGSSYASSDTTLTVVGNVPSNWTNATALYLYRHFPIDTDFWPTYSSVDGRPPIALQQGNAILLSGGMGNTNGLKPIWSGYLDKTFFSGATNKTGGLRFQETYIEQAEIKTSGLTVGTATEVGSSANPLSTGRWFFCVIGETDDGLRSNPIYASTKYFDGDGTNHFTHQLTIDFARLNKRMKYLNLFLGKAPNDTDTTIDWTNLFYVGQYSLLGSDWTWTETVTTTEGYYSLTTAATMSAVEWNNQSKMSSGSSECLVDHLGHQECTSTTCSFSRGVFINNRLFVAKFYDYVEVLEYSDQIRYSDFAWDGRAQLNVLCNLPEFTQTTIEQGDASSIQTLGRWQDKLFILKDSSCYSIPVSDDPSQWQLISVSSTIGCTAPETAIETPYMFCWVQPGEDIYGWDGGEPISLCYNWLNVFQALTTTYKANWTGWYDRNYKSYCWGMDASATTFDTWYIMNFEVPVPNGYLWSSGFIGTTNGSNTKSIVSVAVRKSTGVVYMIVYDSVTGYSIGYFNSSATTDLTLGIEPSFKTSKFTVSEVDLTKILRLYLANSTPAGGSGTMEARLTLDSTNNDYTGISKTQTLHSFGVNFLTNRGREIQFCYNTDLDAGGNAAVFTGLTIYELGLQYELLPFMGDNAFSRPYILIER